jgi:lipopolysaccharide transport system ATP-binding protein
MDLAIRAENISKLYRIGLKDQIHDNLSSALIDFIKSPLKNYKTYRSLYKFDDVNGDSGHDPENVIWALKDVSFEACPERNRKDGRVEESGSLEECRVGGMEEWKGGSLGAVHCSLLIVHCCRMGTGFHAELTGRENVYLNGASLGILGLNMFERILNGEIFGRGSSKKVFITGNEDWGC